MSKSASNSYSWSRIFFGIAVMFSLVGSGNIIVGHSRTLEYTRTLSKTEHRRTSRNSSTSQNNSQGGEDFREIVLRLKSRIEFYELVESGGKAFMALAALFFLVALAAMRPRPEKELSDQSAAGHEQPPEP